MSEEVKGDWYCPQCGYIVDSRVTNSETCDSCHKPVEWHSVDEQDTITRLTAELAEKQRRVEELEGVVVWALGYTDFKPREEGQPAYWWRKELAEKANLDPKAYAALAAREQTKEGE